MFKLTLFLSCLVGSGAGGRKRGVPGGDPPKFINATPINPSMLLNNWDMTTKYVISMINTLPFKKSLLMLKKVKKESEVAQSCPTLQPHGLQPTRLLCPWNFPGTSTGVGCHFLLQGIFLTQGSNPGPLLHCRQTPSSEPPGKPRAGWC